MCGIIGAIGHEEIGGMLLAGLHRLEYRGYDSAGIAIHTSGGLWRERVQGRVSDLEKKIGGHVPSGTAGLGHTRWATHGAPCEKNAHPHGNGEVMVVHNGIVENAAELRETLKDKTIVFESVTDTEVVAHLLHQLLREGRDPQEALYTLNKRLSGSYALGILLKDHPGKIFATRRGHNPLILGRGSQGSFFASDVATLAGWGEDVTHLEDGDIAVLCAEGISVLDEKKRQTQTVWKVNPIHPEETSKGEFSHFMRKEIAEQPHVLDHLFNSLVEGHARFLMPEFSWNPSQIGALRFIGCGTAHYACMVASLLAERWAQIPARAEIASEFRHKEPFLPERALFTFVSQSGETADTLAAFRNIKDNEHWTLAIVNAIQSSLDRQAPHKLYTLAGIEKSVASTKAFTTQLMALTLFLVWLSEKRGALARNERDTILNDLRNLPSLIEDVLTIEDQIAAQARLIVDMKACLFLGRDLLFPVAMEGALKLKEVAYVFARGLAAGELKHGPMALIDESVMTIILAPSGPLFSKTVGSAHEVVSRGGRVLILTDALDHPALGELKDQCLQLPETSMISAPFVYTSALQLLAYHGGCARGVNIDQPRNLAKAVTVE